MSLPNASGKANNLILRFFGAGTNKEVQVVAFIYMFIRLQAQDYVLSHRDFQEGCHSYSNYRVCFTSVSLCTLNLCIFLLILV